MPCQPRRTESLCTPTFVVAQAAVHMMKAVDERPSEAHTRGWCIELTAMYKPGGDPRGSVALVGCM